MAAVLERALAAKRESRRIAIRSSFDIVDIAAIANSGGGAIVLRGAQAPAPGTIFENLRPHTDFADLEVQSNVLLIGEAITPIVIGGIVYVRHGSRSVAATTEDLAKIIDRRVAMVRKAWLSAVRHVVQPETPVADTASVRVVSDPRAPAFRLVDYDKTHPFRQKEVIGVLHDRLPGVRLTQFDLLAIRKTHDVDSRPEFVHKPAFGSNQYSVAFVDWLQRQIERDANFIVTSKENYLRSRKATGTK